MTIGICVSCWGLCWNNRNMTSLFTLSFRLVSTNPSVCSQLLCNIFLSTVSGGYNERQPLKRTSNINVALQDTVGWQLFIFWIHSSPCWISRNSWENRVNMKYLLVQHGLGRKLNPAVTKFWRKILYMQEEIEKMTIAEL